MKKLEYTYQAIEVIWETLTSDTFLELRGTDYGQDIIAVGTARDLLDVDVILSNVNNKLMQKYNVYLENCDNGLFKIKENA